MSFVFQSLLTIGLPLIALPLLIHLINLRKHRRIDWAAMDFLLESQKRNKKWIMLRQLLLLLLRTGAVALVVLMLAGPVLQSEWGRFLGKGSTHHLILLDDSYSMADRWEQTSSLDEAKRVVSLLLDEAAGQANSQKLTLLRFSQAAELTAGTESALHDQTLDAARFDEFISSLDKLQVAESDAGPREAVQAALRLPEPTSDETRIVYVISDFRRQQWHKDADLRQSLAQLRQQSAQLHLIQCVDATRPNLAITRLEPESGIRAAGVEMWIELTVANYGDQPALDVTATVTQDGHKLPAVRIDEIKPAEAVTRRFRAAFANSGPHELKAELGNDPVVTDNVRYFACQVPTEFPLLLIDGSRDGDDGFYLSTALRPAGASTTGWNPQIERPSFLRKHEELAKFAAICLLDVSRLDSSEVTALEKYVAQSGGLALFLGPQINRTFYNEQLYRDGSGLMPAPLDVPTQLLSDANSTLPDVVVSDHPVFRIFGGQRNSFLAVATVNFYYALESTWRPPTSGNTRVLASLRNGAPLVVENRFGDGRVVAHLCKLSPKPTTLGSWSNWSLNPVFPVYAHELVGYLSSSRRESSSREVGAELQLVFPEAEYEPIVQVRGPTKAGAEPMTITPRAADGTYRVDIGRADASGIWHVELQPRDGNPEQRMIAVNVPTGEGDLHHLDRSQLAAQLEGIDYEFSLAAQMSAGSTSLAGFQLGDTMFYLLVGALIVEQWLAYKTSYHNSPVPSAK